MSRPPNGTTSCVARVAWSELVAHRSYLVRFAQRKLHDPMLAEDAVHDVFEAVLSGRARFEGRAAVRSWLTAVLKHKIVDVIRRRARFESLDDDAETEASFAIACPQPCPEDIAAQRERLAHTLARIDRLPETLRSVVQARLLDEQPTEAACARLGITEDNLFVRLHRARRLLAA